MHWFKSVSDGAPAVAAYKKRMTTEYVHLLKLSEF